MLKFHSNITKLVLLAGGLLVMLGACSPDSTGFFSQRWHNTTARYNAYFLARQQLQEVEQQIAENHERNFNQVLDIYPPLDTIMAKQYAEPLQEVMKTASLAIERHKNSKWVDDSYLLVGKARFYGREFESAIETFKYINTKSKDDPTRHKALIFLMRTFLDDQQIANAKGVGDFLRKEKLTNENLRDYHLLMAMFYRHREEWGYMAAHMEEAVAGTDKNDGRATYHFILGQLYQQLEQPEKAYQHFGSVLRSNPDYELSFYARLHMAQVANLGEQQDEKRMRRYFNKLLKDRKNKEYRDKIYYELANFELRRENRDAAIQNYLKSIEVSVNNPRQKSYAFRKLAELYYSEGRYQASQLYYDSTATTMPQDEKDYPMLQERSQIMTDLVAQLNVIEEQDSLLRLASMEQPALVAYLDEVVRQEEQAREQAERKNRQAAASQTNVRGAFNNSTPANMGAASEGSGSVWYFYNPSLLSIGQSEFIRRWGNRPLEDNWRRSGRSRDNNSNPTQAQARQEFEEATAPGQPQEDPSVRLAARREELLANVPLAPEQQQQALAAIEIAFYELGKIFHFQLKEFDPTVGAYTTLLERFPASEHRPEVLYNLYLLYLNKDASKADAYKAELIRQHPQSNYAKSLINPNYEREEDQITNQLKQLYARAYTLYQRQAYTRADSLLQAGLQQHPNHAFNNRLDLLRILIVGHTENLEAYQQALTGFLDKNEDPDLEQYASELLQTSQQFAENGGAAPGPKYTEGPSEPHYFVVVYRPRAVKGNSLLQNIEAYNKREEAARNLKSTTILLTDSKSMIFVSQFSDKKSAMLYYRALERNKLFSGNSENAGLEYFVISKNNFSLLYNTKDVARYIAFFQKFYY